MLLSTLKAVCAAYHRKTASDLTVNGVDLFLVAANNARKNGEKLHNFEACRVVATLDIDGENGGALVDAVIGGASGIDEYAFDPDGSAHYLRAGSYAGHPLYITAVSPASFLYYNLAVASYVLADVVQEEALTDYSVLTPYSTNPEGHYIGVGANFGSDADVVQVGFTFFSGIKEVQNVQRTNGDGTLEPLDFAPSELSITRTRNEQEFSEETWYWNRYPSDARRLYSPGSGTITQRGSSLYIYPRIIANTNEVLAVTLEGYGWLREYVAGDLTSTSEFDMFLQYGADWLQWSIIIELNMYFKTFVPRTEGNLGAPVDLQQAAWRDLILWDTYKVASNLTRSR